MKQLNGQSPNPLPRHRRFSCPRGPVWARQLAFWAGLVFFVLAFAQALQFPLPPWSRMMCLVGLIVWAFAQWVWISPFKKDE